jgi:hypothetical protein
VAKTGRAKNRKVRKMSAKITQDYLVLSPAYGRDYTSKAAVTADFIAGKDFKMESIVPGVGGGTYCSIDDFAPGTKVELRYARLGNATIVEVPQGGAGD